MAEAKKAKKVCILGTAESMGQAPFDDPSWEMWAHAMCINRRNRELPRYDLLFEMHTKWKWAQRVDELNQDGKPVIMQKHFDEVPASEPYPLDEVLETFPRYFTNSIAQMVALAIIRGYTSIGLFGVHLATDGEYVYERPNLEYLLGHAEARGIKLWIPDEANILKAALLYGYEENQVSGQLLALLQDADEKVQRFSQQKQTANDSMHQAMGWRECTKHLMKVASH